MCLATSPTDGSHNCFEPAKSFPIMPKSTPLLRASPEYQVEARRSQQLSSKPNIAQINHTQPSTYPFMNVGVLSSFSLFNIDLTMIERFDVGYEGRSVGTGGVIQLAHDAENPWDLDYIAQYRLADSYYLPREARPFSFSDDSSDDEVEDKEKIQLFKQHSMPDTSSLMQHGEPHRVDDDLFVEPRNITLLQKAQNTVAELNTLFSALLSRLNMRKLPAQSIHSSGLEFPPSVTHGKPERVILRTELDSLAVKSFPPSTAHLRSNMDALAIYLEKKTAALRSTRSKGKPAPSFFTIHPESSGIGSLHT